MIPKSVIDELSKTYFVKTQHNGNIVVIAPSKQILELIAIKYNLRIVRMHANIQDALNPNIPYP